MELLRIFDKNQMIRVSPLNILFSSFSGVAALFGEISFNKRTFCKIKLFIRRVFGTEIIFVICHCLFSAKNHRNLPQKENEKRHRHVIGWGQQRGHMAATGQPVINQHRRKRGRYVTSQTAFIANIVRRSHPPPLCGLNRLVL